MPILRRIQQVIVVIYAATFAVYTLLLGVRTGPDVVGLTIALVIGLITVGPAVLCFRGVRWSRLMLGLSSSLLLLLWAFVPVAQHAIHRTAAFWGWWGYFGFILAAGLVVSFIRISDATGEGGRSCSDGSSQEDEPLMNAHGR